jgi:hypothetical protein
MEGYLSVAEASEKLGVSKQRILFLLASGGLDGSKVSAKCWLVSVASLDARIANPTPPGRPAKAKTGAA